MELTEYAQFVREKSRFDHSMALIYTSIGLSGEVGELMNEVKRHVKSGSVLEETLTNLRRSRIIDELGDVMWYAVALCNTLKIDVQYVLQLNVEKLNEREKTKKES